MERDGDYECRGSCCPSTDDCTEHDSRSRIEHLDCCGIPGTPAPEPQRFGADQRRRPVGTSQQSSRIAMGTSGSVPIGVSNGGAIQCLPRIRLRKACRADAAGPLYADESGRVWFGPSSGGLFWIRNGVVTEARYAGLGDDVVYSIHGGDGELWVGRQRGGVTRLRLQGTRSRPNASPSGRVWRRTTYSRSTALVTAPCGREHSAAERACSKPDGSRPTTRAMVFHRTRSRRFSRPATGRCGLGRRMDLPRSRAAAGGRMRQATGCPRTTSTFFFRIDWA